MKTLKLIPLLLLSVALSHIAKAQEACGIFEVYPLHTGFDSIQLLPINLATATDSAAATLVIDYGDGTIDTTHSFDSVRVHGYANEQEYIICLTYTSPGCTSTYCDTVDVVRCPPQPFKVVQIYLTSGVVKFQVNLAGAVSDSYNWNFGNNATPSTSTSTIPTVTFTGSGIYNASVDVSTGGCTQTVPFLVNMQGCNATIEETHLDGVNLAMLADTALNMFYTWDIDGKYSWTGDSLMYTLNDFKPYNVCLNTATAACRDTVCQTVTPVPGQDSIYGHVYKGDEPACDITIYLIQQTSPGVETAIDSTYPIYSTPMSQPQECVGTYTMKVPTGNYYLKAKFLSFSSDKFIYAPTYFGDDTLLANAKVVNRDSTGNLVINMVSRLPQDTTGTGIHELGNLQLHSLYPNPTTDKATLIITATQSGVATLQLADVTGRVLHSNTTNLIAGTNEISIDMGSHANGLYYLNVTDGSGRLTLKLLKAK